MTLTFQQLIEVRALVEQLKDDPRGAKISPHSWGSVLQALPVLLEGYEQRERMKGLLVRARDFTKRKWQEGTSVQVSQVTTAFIKAVEAELTGSL